MTDENVTQRRLEREARTNYIARLEDNARPDLDTAGARVEVTYARAASPDYPRAGYFHVVVPSFEPCGHEDLDRDRHPATLAEQMVVDHFSKLGDEIDWYEIDDISAW